MPMIDIGLKIEIDETAGTDIPTALTVLKDCLSVPALIQPSSKLAVDFVGDEFITEILGKRTVAGLDFTFAYDGTGSGDQFKKLNDLADAGKQHWLIITYPDSTKFEMLVELEVSLMAVSPSSELTYVVSVTPIKQTVTDGEAYEIIHIVESGGTDPLAVAEVPAGN